MRIGCAEAKHCTEHHKSKAPDRSEALNAAGVHPASNRFAHFASRFVNNLRPVLGKMAAGDAGARRDGFA